MIGAAALPLALALQASAFVPTMLLIRKDSSETILPIVPTSHGLSVRVEPATTIFGGRVRLLATGHYEVAFPGASFDLVEEVPFANLAGDVIPMGGSPYVSGGALYVPFQLLTDILPRVAAGYAYDAERVELRYFPSLQPAPAPGKTVFARPPPSPPVVTPTAPSSSPVIQPPDTAANRAPPAVAAAAPASTTPPPIRPPDSIANPSPPAIAAVLPARLPAVPVAGARARDPKAGRAPETHRRVVVVDAGHGGPDNGTHGPLARRRQTYEKDITLAVAKKLAEGLRKRGLDVVMTRTTDTLIGLYDRGPIANARHGDLFVSIHVNAPGPSEKRPEKVRGFETYFLSEAKTEDERRVEKMENSAVRFETGADAPKDDPLGFIINDMAQNEHLRESQDLAETVQEYLARVSPGPNRGVKQAGLVVLNTAYMPAVLVEIGFVTNADESVFLTSATRQRRIANAIADAAVTYLARYERRVRTGEAVP